MRRFDSFIKDWDIVADKMPAYIVELRERVVRDDRRSGYVGVRAELAIAAYLLRKGVELGRGPQEGADFLVSRPQGTVLIECTSSHLSNPREDNFHKIESAIRRKAKEPYCGRDAMLHVEFTAIMHQGGDPDSQNFLDRVGSVVRDTRWGAVVLSNFMVSSGDSSYSRGFLRFDGAEQAKSLRVFLDEVVPQGRVFLSAPVSIPPTP
jgi:hypothetical protein